MDIYYDESGREHMKPDDIEPEWRVSAYAVVRDETGKVLMVQPTWNDFWELPGGGIEKAETLRAGVVRECYEETGYRIEVDEQPFYVADRNFCNTNRERERYFKSVILVYRGRLVNEERNLDALNQEMDEITKVEWVDVQTLTEGNTQPIIWPVIQKLKVL